MSNTNINMELVEMTLDIMKYTLNRLTQSSPHLGFVESETKLKEMVGETIIPEGIGGEKALEIWKNILAKNVMSIDHPRHLAFVPAAPARAAVLFDLVTAATSIHGSYWLEGAGGIFAENQAMEWLVKLTGLPQGAFGVFTTGGTSANLSALAVARESWRLKNPENSEKKGIIIISSEAHSSVASMAKLIDVEVRTVQINDCLTGDLIENKCKELTEDEKSRVFCVIATAGTTNAGIVDDLEGVAKVCQKNNWWFHVDAAYGGAALLADSVRHLFAGIEKADSITIDPHKWLFSPYDCGAIIYKDPEFARSVHKQEASYLDIFKETEANGFNPSDYQVQLTRRVRGLPLWFSLAMHGTNRYKDAIEWDLTLAQMAAEKITKNPELELVREPGLSCVLFKKKGWNSEDYKNWTFKNLESGLAFVAPTRWKINGKSETVLRFCFINPDTTEEDIDLILNSFE
ncbi:MAG: aminotransferase class V-fold PLP-dependent enzyme [Weeksellaceae bacterium]|nr:aminotransferase class V-fold PLP-dependent enzyme [Weeksellaceae bacterium]